MRVSELIHVENPWRSRFRWMVVFTVLFMGIIFASFIALDHIRTYSLPTGGVQLHMQYSQYLVGEAISFNIKNDFNSSISIVTSCPSEPVSIYQSVAKHWVRIHDTTAATNCSTMTNIMQIPAAGSSTVSLANWPHLFLTAGTYRIALQVQYSNALPYTDFVVMTPPAPFVAKALNTISSNTSHQVAYADNDSITAQSTTTSNTQNQNPNPNPNQNPPTTPTSLPPPTSRTPQTITLYTDSAGNYATTNINMYIGDTLKIVYQAPYGNEVRTHFTPTTTTTGAIGSMTVDSEFKSISQILSSAGSWVFRADDHNGNSGSLVVFR